MAEMNVDITEIMRLIPHRYPFLLVDKVTDVAEEGGKGYKNITMNEEFFQGHFPGRPIMPGVLIIEGMAQCAGIIALKFFEIRDGANATPKERLIYFMMIDKVKFRRPVVPGDKLEYQIDFIKLSNRIIKFAGKATVNGELAAEAEMTAMMDEKK